MKTSKAEQARTRFTTHGLANSRVYSIWKGMKKRCSWSGERQWKDYGGRGIKVCERWQRFEGFFADMGHPPSPQHSLDRIDNNGNYERDNCRWATKLEQAKNSRKVRFLTFNGETKTHGEWARSLNIDSSTLSERLARGWPIEDALTLSRSNRWTRRKSHSPTL